ncbi:MAG: hypothetical protein V4697_00890 [Patescibacteria group bacterium]
MSICTRVVVCQDARTRQLKRVATENELNAFPFDAVLRERLREQCNRDLALMLLLREKDREVWLFDGYEDDLVTPIKTPALGADKLNALITQNAANGLVFDLAYFGDFEYGMEMLRALQKMGTLHSLTKLVVVSWFLHEQMHDFPRRLSDEFNVQPERLVYALRAPIDHIESLL